MRTGNVSMLVLMLLSQVPATVSADGKIATVVMFGDSTTFCSFNKPGAKLTDYVQAHFTNPKRIQATIINSGRNGDTAQGGYARLQQAVFAHHPDVVTISFGLNDTGSFTPDEYRDWLEKIVQAIRDSSQQA